MNKYNDYIKSKRKILLVLYDPQLSYKLLLSDANFLQTLRISIIKSVANFAVTSKEYKIELIQHVLSND